jgi:hypothetical protein
MTLEREGRLLSRYFSSAGGDLYLEVPIGGPGGEGKSPPGSATRRLNGVRLSGCLTDGWIYGFRASREKFLERIRRGPVELGQDMAGPIRYRPGHRWSAHA